MTALLEVEGLVKHFVAARSVFGRPTATANLTHSGSRFSSASLRAAQRPGHEERQL